MYVSFLPIGLFLLGIKTIPLIGILVSLLIHIYFACRLYLVWAAFFELRTLSRSALTIAKVFKY